jgi:RNA polymerase sigma-70 factor (ECF subfamily)
MAHAAIARFGDTDDAARRPKMVMEATPPISDLALARIFRSACPSPVDARVEDEALGEALRALFEEGRRRFPSLELAAEVFATHLAARTRDGLSGVERGPDLYLACACTTRVPGALDVFERTHLVDIGAHLGRLKPTPAFVDEVRQEVRDKLYLGREGGAPKIAEYDGRGALASWVRVIAIRTAIDLRRQAGYVTASSVRARDAHTAHDPEGDYQREQHRRAFDEALRGAVAALDSEQRKLLRLHFAEGLTLDTLAAELGVHRATIARRLAAARAGLRQDTRRRLRAALGTSDSELTRLAAAMRSHLDFSLPSLLRSA